MFAKYIIALCAISAASAFDAPLSYGAPLAYNTVTSQHQNTLRSFGNLAQVSTSSKTIDTPFSSVSKSDVRVSNPGVLTHSFAHPGLAYTAPIAARVAAPGLLGVAYSSAPLVSHMVYSNALGLAYEY